MDAQHLELTSFLSRLLSDEDTPEYVRYIAERAYGVMFEPRGDTIHVQRVMHDAIWAALERTHYLPPQYVLEP